MARTPAGLPAGIRLSDHISLGVLARTFPLDQVRKVLIETGKSQRAGARPAGPGHGLLCHRLSAVHDRQHAGGAALPARGPALALGCGGVQGGGHAAASRRPAPGWATEPLRRLYERLVRPDRDPCDARRRLVSAGGAWSAWTAPVSMSPTPAANRTVFERPEASRGESAFPQLRFVALVENGTHVLFGGAPGQLREPARRRWRSGCWRRCGRACCAWPTGSSSAMRCGRRRPPRVPTCSGG